MPYTSSQAISGFGGIFSWNGTAIAEFQQPTLPKVSIKTVDVTNQSSVQAFSEFIAGLKDGGQFSFDANFIPSDTNGQIAFMTDANAGTVRQAIFTFPAAAGATLTFNGLITDFQLKAPMDKSLGFTATIQITGVPVLGITSSQGLTGLTISVGTLSPAFAQAVLNYTVPEVVGTGSLTVTPTQAAGVIKVNGSTATTGNPVTITLGAAGTMTVVNITQTDSGKAPVTYNIYITRASS